MAGAEPDVEDQHEGAQAFALADVADLVVEQASGRTSDGDHHLAKSVGVEAEQAQHAAGRTADVRGDPGPAGVIPVGPATSGRDEECPDRGHGSGPCGGGRTTGSGCRPWRRPVLDAYAEPAERVAGHRVRRRPEWGQHPLLLLALFQEPPPGPERTQAHECDDGGAGSGSSCGHGRRQSSSGQRTVPAGSSAFRVSRAGSGGAATVRRMSDSPRSSAALATLGRLRGALPPETAFVGARLHAAIAVVVASVFVLVDQATKHWADTSLTRGRLVDVAGERFGLQLTYNDGGAWGFPAPSWFFLAVTVVVVVIVVRNLPHVTTGRASAAYGLLLAGAVGNALDRVFRTGDPEDPRFLFGHVVDFVAVELPSWLGPLGGSFPRFNVADIAISIGFVLLAWDLLREPDDAGDDDDAAAEVQDEPTPTALPVTIS